MLYFLLFHLILTTNPWSHGIIPTFYIRGLRGPWSSSSFLLWTAKPVLWGVGVAESEEQGEGGKVRVKRQAAECWGGWKRWGNCSSPGESRRKGVVSEAALWSVYLFQTVGKNIRIELGLLWNYISVGWLCFFVWDTALRPDHMGDGFMSTAVFWMANYT